MGIPGASTPHQSIELHTAQSTPQEQPRNIQLRCPSPYSLLPGDVSKSSKAYQTTSQSMVENPPVLGRSQKSTLACDKDPKNTRGPKTSRRIDASSRGEALLLPRKKTSTPRLTGRQSPSPPGRTTATALTVKEGSASVVSFKPYHTSHRQLFNLSLLRTSTHEWERDKWVQCKEHLGLGWG